MRTIGRIIAFLATAVVFLGVGAAGYAALQHQLPFQTETVDRSQPVLLRSIQDIAQFHAAVGSLEVVLDQEKNVKWVPGFIAGERSLFVAGGTVNAYVDLSRLGSGDLTLSAEESELRERADANTRAMLVGMFDALDIEVTFTDGR